MPVSATLCNLPLSTTCDAQEEKSKLSLNWVLQNGIRTVRSVASGILTVPGLDTGFSVHMDLPVAILSSPFDVILGRDWLQYCRESVPNSRLCLSSGVVELGRRLIDHMVRPQIKSGALAAPGTERLIAEPVRNSREPSPTTHGTLRAHMQADPFSDQLGAPTA
ncbi:hypothetical protein K438DRAFT_1777067 [Mycena galopus ATCC 62051]|nr:hypothetical protein K438DRAFT_1777067 [Mycena galopus ATCC 62051]